MIMAVIALMVVVWIGAAGVTDQLIRGPCQLEIQEVTFSGTSNTSSNTIVLTVQHQLGSYEDTVTKYKLGLSGTVHDIPEVHMAEGANATITCPTGADGEAWISGITYDIFIITLTGKQFPYRATAP